MVMGMLEHHRVIQREGGIFTYQCCQPDNLVEPNGSNQPSVLQMLRCDWLKLLVG